MIESGNQNDNPTENPEDEKEEEKKEETEDKFESEFTGDIIYAGHKENGFNYEENMPEPSYEGLEHISFNESDEIFPNPERGFYKHYDFTSSKASPLSSTTLKADRVSGITLCYTGHYLTEFLTSDISEDFLKLLRNNMEALRKGGVNVS